MTQETKQDELYDCATHGPTKPEWVGTIVVSPMCSLCMTEFREQIQELIKNPTHIIPIIK
jgi:hypothetical protein